MKSPSPVDPAFGRDAFTLIELLVVIAIIAILAGLLLQTAGVVQEKASRARAEAEMKGIESGLEGFKLDFGSYPEQLTPNDTSTKVLINELALNPIKHPEQYNYKKPYEFSLRILQAYRPGASTSYQQLLETSNQLVDPFGNPYHYQFPGDPKRSGEQSFDLFSKGKKNQGADNSTEKKDTDRWIKNW